MSGKIRALAVQEGTVQEEAPAMPLALVPAVKPVAPTSPPGPPDRKAPAAAPATTPTTDDGSPAYWRRYYDA